MKKLLISIVTVLLFACAKSQIIYINKYARINAGFMQVDTCLCGQWFTMATRVYVDNKPAGGGGSMLTINSPLTGVSYNGSSPITIGIDTTIVATRAYVGNNIPLTVYTGDGSTNGNRTIDLGAFSFRFLNSGGQAFYIDPQIASVAVTNGAGINTSFNLYNGTFDLFGDNNSSTTAEIFGDAVNDSIAYIAGAQRFYANTISAFPLKTGISASTTSGTRQSIISDANGLLSFTNKTFDSIPYSATPTWDYPTGYNKTIKLTGDASLLFTNVQDGDQGTLIVIQGVGGGHALTVPDQVITLNTSAGDTTVLGFIFQNGVYYWASSVVGAQTLQQVMDAGNTTTDDYINSVAGAESRITPAEFRTYHPDGGGMAVIWSSASTSAFPGLAYWTGAANTKTVLQGTTGAHWTTSDKHFDLIDLRGSLTYAAIQAGGVNKFTFSTGGDMIATNSILVGSGSLNTSAILQATSTTKGFLPPVVTTTQMNAISTPATGLLVWNSDSLELCKYNGTAWRKVGGSSSGSSGITIGTTTITSGTNGRVLYDNSGTVGEMTTTGSGTVLALATSPAFTTPSLGVATATTINGNTFTTGTYTLTGVAGKTLTFNKSITLEGTDATTMTFPTTSATIARTDAANTFTGVQTFSSAPVFSTATATVNSVTANVMLKQINAVSSNSVTPVDGASVNIYEITASAGLTINAASGTEHDGDELYLLIEGGGTARAITWNALYSPSTDIPLPTTTIINKLMVCKFIYTTMGSRNKYLFVGFVNNFP